MGDRSVVGWDIGGVNTKIARVRDGCILAAQTRAFEVQRAPEALVALLASLASDVGSVSDDAHVVTMTAELSQMFRTKREGVRFVVDAVCSAFPASDIHVFSVDGNFLSPHDARRNPLAVAASNWAATATLVALDYPDAMLIDIGTTTTDIIPIVGGRVVALGRTDPARLASGELVYTGAVRTPVEAIVHDVPLNGARARVSAESFALAGDVHVWRGDLLPTDYTAPTPDGRAASREFAGERLARVVCADREILDVDAISAIADEVALRQIEIIASAIRRVRERHPTLRSAVVAGLGAFIADASARAAGLEVVSLAESIGADASRAAPAAAVALLLDAATTAVSAHLLRRQPPPPLDSAPAVDAVIKVGGGLLSHPDALDAVLRAVCDAAPRARVVIIPGGGPFANAVRDADRVHHLGDDAAHWMAVLAMDQYAHLLTHRHAKLSLVTTRVELEYALSSGKVPVLAPYGWLRHADPLPHSWDVTSDSISGWFAGAFSAARLVVVKPPGANAARGVDPYFLTAVPPDVRVSIIPADRIDDLTASLSPRDQTATRD